MPRKWAAPNNFQFLLYAASFLSFSTASVWIVDRPFLWLGEAATYAVIFSLLCLYPVKWALRRAFPALWNPLLRTGTDPRFVNLGALAILLAAWFLIANSALSRAPLQTRIGLTQGKMEISHRSKRGITLKHYLKIELTVPAATAGEPRLVQLMVAKEEFDRAEAGKTKVALVVDPGLFGLPVLESYRIDP